MRTLVDHKLNGLNDALEITAVDEPDSAGAHHDYEITAPGKTEGRNIFARIHFQNGPIGKVGIDGISIEALIAIAIDRLRCYQGGRYACRENACALTKFEEGMMWLQRRTRDRLARGVEGTSVK